MTPRIFDAPVIETDDLFNVPGFEAGYGHHSQQNNTWSSSSGSLSRSDSYDVVSPRSSSDSYRSSSSSTASSLMEEAQNAARERKRASLQEGFEERMEKMKLGQ